MAPYQCRVNRKTARTLPLVLMLLSGSIQSEVPKNANAAADARYECEVPAEFSDLVKTGYAMAEHRYDKNQLACAADLLFKASNDAPEDAALAIGALAVSADYLDQVAILKNADLAGIQSEEWALRLEHGTHQASELIHRLQTLAPDQAEALALHGISIAAINQFENPAKVKEAVDDAIALLSEAIEKNPMVLDGQAMSILGRIYFEIPVLLGGDADKALTLYERAYAQTPKSVQLLRYLAEYWDGELEEEKALGYLREMLALKPSFAELQLFVDELRLANGLAERLGDEALHQQLKDKRSKLLEAHPMLNARKSPASAGHGGVDPLTGEPQY